MSEAFNRIETSLQEAISYAEGEEINVRVYKPFDVNVKKIRNDVGLSQTQFAAAIGIGLGTLRHWERGDRQPRGAALVLLNLLSKEPNKILKMLHQ